MAYLEVMKYEYNLKGVGQPEYYLGGDMKIGKDGKMSWSAKIKIKNDTERIEKLLEVNSQS